MSESHSNERSRRFVDRLVRARAERETVSVDGSLRPADEPEAYAVQDAVASAIWEAQPIGAWKVGASGIDAEPNAAPIAASLVHDSGVHLAPANYHVLGIEGELAFRLGRDLPGTETPPDHQTLLDAIASVHPAIEVVDSRLASLDTAGALEKLADFQSNGGLVVGPAGAGAGAGSVDVPSQRARLLVNGETRVETTGGNVAVDLLRLVGWLGPHAAARGRPLAAGQWITTGSFTGLIFVQPGDTVSIEFDRLGEAHLTFDASD